jgi:hypothetical protein
MINSFSKSKCKILFISFIVFILPIFSKGQSTEKPGTLILKTNLLNLVAKGPSVSFEHFVNQSYSLEFTYMKGEFNDVLFTDHYDYEGFLLRGKKFFNGMEKGQLSHYLGAYTGILNRNIHTVGHEGLFGYPDRDFSAQSIRGGLSIGAEWLSKNNFVADIQTSLGYGKYINLDKSDPDTYSNGYLDTQIWISIGYNF